MHTERVRVRLVHVEHLAEKRHAEILQEAAKQREAAKAEVRELTELVKRMGTGAPQARPTPPGPSGSSRDDPPQDSTDPTIVRVNTSKTPVSRAHAFEAMRAFAERFATVEPAHLLIAAGPPSAKSFVIKVDGERSCAITRAAELIRELRDEAGAWREITVPIVDAGPVRLYAGPDRCRAQISMEITGKRLVKILAQHSPRRTFTTDARTTKSSPTDGLSRR